MNNTIFESKMLAVEEAAQKLSLSKSYLYHLVWKRKIPFRKVGKRVLFHPSDLQRWLDEKVSGSLLQETMK